MGRRLGYGPSIRSWLTGCGELAAERDGALVVLDLNGPMTIRHRVGLGVVEVSKCFATAVPESAEMAVRMAISEINATLPVPGLGWNRAERVVVMRVVLMLDADDAVSEEALGSAIQTCRGTIDQMHGWLERVCRADAPAPVEEPWWAGAA